MTWIRRFQGRIAVLAAVGAIGIVVQTTLSEDFALTGFWAWPNGFAVLGAIDAVFIARSHPWATRAAYGGIACTLGAAIVLLVQAIPGTPLSQPLQAGNHAIYAFVAIATTVVLSAAFLMLRRKLREPKELGATSAAGALSSSDVVRP